MQTTTIETGNLFEASQARMNEIKEYKQQPITTTGRNVAFAGLTVGFGLLFIMFAAQIITGVFAAILTVTAGVGGYFGLKFLKQMDPVIQQKLKNKKLAMMIEEAQENAIAQLQNTVIANGNKLAKARDAVSKVSAQLKHLKGMLRGDPESASYKKKVETINVIEKSLSQMKRNVDRMAIMDKEFQKKVEDHVEMKKFADAAGNILALIEKNGDAELDRMLSLEAFASIETDFNEAVSELELSAHYAEIDNA